jgi:Tol biopolymer transport system component
MIGQTLAQYEITAKLGAGGMGEVYRARDTRLGRSVAVKVLPRVFAPDPVRLRRFEQEARTLAALNHPNLLVIHDTGAHEGAPYLVSELLEGQTLRELLQAGRITDRKVVEYSSQIALGLAAAHAKAVVHRDLKPENLFITKDGRVKILDFGLAKLRDHGSGDAEADPNAATVLHKTQPGMVLGTVGYMSPEQVRGGEADHRSDVFSFGVVLYEMVSGKQPFRRESSVETMHAILSDEPPDLAETLPSAAPALSRLVAKCLAKDPEERWQTAKDLADELRWIAQSDTPSGAQKPVLGNVDRRVWIRRGALAALLMALAAAIAFNVRPFWQLAPGRQTASNAVLRLAIPLELPGHLAVSTIALSPDGRHMAFTTHDRIANKAKLWLRPMGLLAASVLQEEGSYPFWSPDSRFIAFFADKKLKKVRLEGGPPQTICEVAGGRGGTWNRDGVIVFAPSGTSGLLKVPAGGGEPVEVTKRATNQTDSARREVGHRFPQFLPDERHFLYYARLSDPSRSGMYASSLEGGEPKRILTTSFQAVYAVPGYLLFCVDGTLMAQPFDSRELALRGEAKPVVEEIEVWAPTGELKLTVSETGALAYLRDTGAYLRALVWMDRDGKELETLPVNFTDGFDNPSLSADGKRVVLDRAGRRGIWLLDAPMAAPVRFTFGQGRDWFPLWAPDGKKVIFASNRSGRFHFYQKLATGIADEELIYKDELFGTRLKVASDVSPDGRFLLYLQSEPEDRPWRLWVLALDGKSPPAPLRNTAIGEDCGVFSPDGRWVAYRSEESGGSQVYVQDFPNPTRKWQVSTTVGFHPRWNPNGKELFYIMADAKAKKLMAVEVEERKAGELTYGSSKPLFDVTLNHQPMRAQYLVAPDGKRFLVYKEVAQTNSAPSAPLTVVLNWAAGLKP